MTSLRLLYSMICISMHGRDPPTYIPSEENWGVQPTTAPVVYSDVHSSCRSHFRLSTFSHHCGLIPRLLILSFHVLRPILHSGSPSNKSMMLQNLAKKISQKNHRLAAMASSSLAEQCSPSSSELVQAVDALVLILKLPQPVWCQYCGSNCPSWSLVPTRMLHVPPEHRDEHAHCCQAMVLLTRSLA